MSDGIASWSNAKKARFFLAVIAHLTAKHGDHGELRIKLADIETRITLGVDTDDGDLILAVDMDSIEVGSDE